MIVYPAIDLRGGKVVRLREGDPDRQTVFSDDPLTVARRWLDAGAGWIHMVNLDGAFAAANDNSTILTHAAALGGRIQFGGGLRSLTDIETAFDHGANRVVLGTIALTQPDIVVQAAQRWGADAVCVALDARDGYIATHGWQEKSSITAIELGQQMYDSGVRHALFTDVSRDGKLSGVNVEATAELARVTGLQVIASGGVRSLDDIRQLAHIPEIAGVVIGMALYTGQFTLEEALALC